MERVTQFKVFDFDETIFRMPGYTGKIQSETSELKFTHPYDFYDHPSSLSDSIYNIQLIKPVYEAWKRGHEQKNTISVLITHRVESLKPEVTAILDKYGLSFDETFFLGRKSNKSETVRGLISKYPSVSKIDIYEDSIQQIADYQSFFKTFNSTISELSKIKYKTYIVDKSRVYRIKKVNLSEESKIELI